MGTKYNDYQKKTVYDIYGDFVCSVHGEWGQGSEDGVLIGYHEEKGFYELHTKWDEVWEERTWGEPSYLKKHLDADYHVTKTPPGNSYASYKEPSSPSPQLSQPQRQPQPFQVWVDCPMCMGGECPTCDGQGWRWVSLGHPYEQCVNCGGSGKCTLCNGQGGHYETEYR